MPEHATGAARPGEPDEPPDDDALTSGSRSARPAGEPPEDGGSWPAGPDEPSEPPDDDVDALTSAVLTASRLLVGVAVRSLAAVRERVTLPQFRMLVVLATHGRMKLSALAEQLAVNPSTAMRMADRLCAADLVDRQVNPASRREVLLRLTEPGRQIVDDVTAHRRDEIAAIVARMPPGQRTGLITALRAFIDAGGEPTADGPARDVLSLGWD